MAVTALRAHVRTLALAGRLGFEMESNWLPLWGYLLYALVRPIAMSLIIILMYVVTGARDPERLAFMFAGNAFFIFVGSVLFGINNVVIEDREHYQVLKYIFTAPVSIYAFLLGRGLTKSAIAVFSVAVTLAFGFAALPIAPPPGGIRWALLLASTLLGLTSLVFLGILLAGFTLNTARHAGFLSEAVAGVLYLFCGAVFPPSLLPPALEWIARALPLTWWIELSRRAAVGRASFETGLDGWSDGAMLVLLALTTAACAAASLLGYRAFERRARRLGKLDQTTNY